MQLQVDELQVEDQQPLIIDAIDPAGASPRLSAASGLVTRQGRAYVVVDDERHLAVFDANGVGRWLRLFGGELPDDAARRKADKPDLETLIELPASEALPFGSLLGLASGSRPNRHAAVVLAFDAAGEVTGAPRHLDLTPLYAPLRQRFGELNIEGGLVLGDTFMLLQRANRGEARNLCIRFAWREVQAWLMNHRMATPQVLAFDDHDLGHMDGVPLGFTDAAAVPGGHWLFCAVAEDTSDSYQDGPCAGTAIGCVDAIGTMRSLWRLSGNWKAEGLAAALGADGDSLALTLVTDADDRARNAMLLTVRMSLSAALKPASRPRRRRP